MKARQDEINEVDDFLAPTIDIEKSMKYGSLRYKKNQGPKQDWNYNMLQRSMIGDEAQLKEGLAIKEKNKVRR
jgi:hypothetical protein